MNNNKFFIVKYAEIFMDKYTEDLVQDLKDYKKIQLQSI